MIPSPDLPTDKDAPAVQTAPVGRHGNSGEGAASVLRALREGSGQRLRPSRSEDAPASDAPADK
ncbi:hypothetical protein [Ramlibacter alkalitolerans]|uniref:Uncharacterized protein n=1 Tax=Ramlibacter alkalitolerans TaxID=2039631 RepID=A0ABS1JVG1_9BURK|nr:hypothetical protein [Ramlibacter alkalitolerans]MBL0428290.1 hypothetical protein [Ramlibacter alkalitolerans]